MTERLTITCPHCAFSRTVPAAAIPPGAGQATCPACKRPFGLNADTMRPQQAEPDPPLPPAVTPPPRSAPRPAQRVLGFAFHGSARDYFGIWIVNSLLKIVTIGIYSAWAKVRKRRFFYGSTTLDGHSFDYLADPLALFKGWLIAAAAFILYSIGTRISPILSSVIALIVFAAFPWLLVRSRIFNARNSSYRNIRFDFRPDYRQAYVVYAGLPILTGLTLGILAPYMIYRQKRFMVENSSYGATGFGFSATVKQFYLLSLKVSLAFLAVLGLVGLLVALSGGSVLTAGGMKGAGGLIALIPFLLMALVYLVVMVYARTALANLTWNATRLGDGTFRSSLRTGDMALLTLTNTLAIVFSLGLLMPWAAVRLARYRFEHLELVTGRGLDDVLAAAGSSAVGAAGEEIGDLFDMPVEIAL